MCGEAKCEVRGFRFAVRVKNLISRILAFFVSIECARSITYCEGVATPILQVVAPRSQERGDGGKSNDRAFSAQAHSASSVSFGSFLCTKKRTGGSSPGTSHTSCENSLPQEHNRVKSDPSAVINNMRQGLGVICRHGELGQIMGQF